MRPPKRTCAGGIALAVALLVARSAQAHPLVYLTNTNGSAPNNDQDSITVIDAATRSIVTVIPVGRLPLDVAVAPGSATVFVANSGSGDVSVIDVASHTVSATIPVGLIPSRVAISPDGARAYVTISGSDRVAVIDTGSRTVATTLEVGDYPLDVAISPDGSNAYVTNSLSNNVSVIDTATAALTDTITLPPAVPADPWAIAFAPDGATAYVAARINTPPFEGVLHVIDTDQHEVLTTIPVGRMPADLAISPDGELAYVANTGSLLFGGSLSVIDITTNEPLTTLSPRRTLFGVAFTQNGTAAYVTARGVVPVLAGSVLLVNARTHAITAEIAVSGSPGAVAITSSPAGDANCDDAVTAADVTELVHLIATGGRASCGLDDPSKNEEVDEADLPPTIALIFDSLLGIERPPSALGLRGA